ncbi:O-antigen ligase family protein [Patescibacteria group bacterium]|nr:O-antigen ligase family protein [Patescibacteria group bacterium]MBU4512435.1 O-antigen ligase family protein [Patescibacteria group bacterium]MCG2692563.1 O-antigen ligase family protein [Candidatus Parcubacteria bacterium]
MSRLESIYVNIIKFGTYVILFVPLLITKQFYFPYIFGKAITIRSIVEIMAVVYILLVLHNPRFKPRCSLLFWGVVVFMGVKVLSTLMGVNVYHSFWSNYERMEGLLTLLHFGILFVIVSGVFKEKKEWLTLFRIAVSASFCVALYGLGQKLGLSSLLHSDIEKIDSTIGNSSYVAIYLVMNFFITVYLFIKDRNLFWRIFYGIILLLDVIIIFFTASRGGMLGLLGGIFLLLIFVVFFTPIGLVKKGYKYSAIGTVIFLILTVGTIYLNKGKEFINNIHVLRKLTTISFADRTIQDRFINWNIGWQGWKERPILGYGPENYYVSFNKYYNSRTSEPWFDRAHNIIFDQLNSSGILGLASYLFILCVSLYYLWKKRNRDFWLSVSFIGLIFGYFFANLFVFDNSSTYAIFFLVLAFINFIVSGQEDAEDEQAEPSRKSVSVFIPLGLLAVLTFSLYFFNIRPAIANNIGIEAYKYSRVNYSKSVDLFKKALAYNTFGNPEMSLRIGDYALHLFNELDEEKREVKEILDFAIQELEASINEEPLNARYYLYVASLYNVRSRVENREENLNMVLKHLNKAKELSPERIEVYFQLGQIALSAGDRGQAVRDFEKAFKIRPDSNDTQLNLMLAYLYVGDKEKIDKQFEILRDFGFVVLGGNQVEKLVAALYAIKELDKIIQLLEAYLASYPSSEFYAKLATVCLEAGNKEKAREYTLKAMELNPDLKEEGEVFLEQLEE